MDTHPFVLAGLLVAFAALCIYLMVHAHFADKQDAIDAAEIAAHEEFMKIVRGDR